MDATEDLDKRKEIILEVVKGTLRPEFFNRLSYVLAFNSLTATELERIVNTHLDKLRKKLAEDREIGLVVSPEAVAYLAKESYDPAYGARPVGRTMQRLVLSPLATVILSGEVAAGQTLHIGYEEASGLNIGVEDSRAAAV
jgi:ATP-dependent Clp protease ATP-binding subunit ClpB